MKTSILLLLLLPLSLLAQTPAEQVSLHMQQLRHGQRQPFTETLLQETRQQMALFAAARAFTRDTLAAVQAEAYGLIGAIGLHSQDARLRQQATGQLLEAFSKTPLAAGRVIGLLERYQPADFSAASQKQLGLLIQQPVPYRQRLLRLVGALGLQEQESELLALAQDKTRGERLRWSAYLALSRMGHEEATQLIVAKIRRQPLGDDLVYELLPDLAWVCQRAATDYLLELLLLDSRDCSSPDPDSSEKITCAYRILELLAPMIADFPLKVGPTGDIETNSYPQALQEAREWVRKNGRSYQLVRGEG
ncbi:MAG: hypothetical protein KY428_09105 [Bacteroidetes bacterium]|nr:hypothetical protein [Bacteroidota bacterium]